MTARDAATMFVLDVGAVARCARRAVDARRDGCADDGAEDENDDVDDARRSTDGARASTTTAATTMPTTFRACVARTVRACVRSKVQLRTPAQKLHATALTLCGCEDTRNDVASAAMEDGGDGSEYVGIVAARSLRPPDAQTGETYERDIIEARASDGVADVVEAVAVACDALIRAYTPEDATAATRKRLAACVKEVVLITDGIGAKTMPRPSDDEFASTLLAGMRAQNIRLKVGALDAGEFARLRDDVGARSDEHASTARGVESDARFDALREACETLATNDASNDSGVEAASKTLIDLQIKRVRPTPGYRGTLSFGFNAFVNVGLYKLNTEAPPVKLNKYSEDLADRPDESHRALVDVAYKNVNDLDGDLVPVERHVKAFRYGKQHVPIDAEMEQRLSMRFDKGLKVIGSIRLDEAPLWLSVGEPSLVLPQPSTKTTGISKDRAEADAIALSALARALDDAKLALLVRGAWTESTTTIHIGALTPHFTDAGDFLLYTPLPFKEDYNEYSLPKPRDRVDSGDERLDAARAFIDAHALNENAPMPWETLNPTLAHYRDVFEARALGKRPPEPKEVRFARTRGETSAFAFAERFQLAVDEASTERRVRPRLDAGDAGVEEHAAPSPVKSPGGATNDGLATVDVWHDVVKEEPTDDAENARSPEPAPADLEVFDDME